MNKRLIFIILVLIVFSYPFYIFSEEKKPLNLTDIEKFLKSGVVSSKVIIKLITEHGINFVATDETLDSLRRAGADTGVVEAVKQASANYMKKPDSVDREDKRIETMPLSPTIYERAYRAFIDKRYKDARDDFERFIKEFPNDDLRDNAQFWIGETYYEEKSFEDAILAYEELLRKNSTSDKTPKAMLKQGLAFYELNDKKTCRIILEKLIGRFPNSEEAKVAEEKLKEGVKKKEQFLILIEKPDTHKGYIYVNTEPPSADILYGILFSLSFERIAEASSDERFE